MGQQESSDGGRARAVAGPALADCFDEDELALLRAAFKRGGEHGLDRSHFDAAFGSMLPSAAVDRFLERLAPGDGDGRRVAWDGWVDGLARACKAQPCAVDLGDANAARLGALWDLMAARDASPSAAVVTLDSHAHEPHGEEPGAGGALDERALLALLVCCARHCSDAHALGGVSAMAPMAADALLAGPLSRAAWVRWARACVPLLGEAFELLVMRGVAQLAAAARPAERTVRLAEQRLLPTLVGLNGQPAPDGAPPPSLVITPALTWAISLAVPQPASGAPTVLWRLLYSSAEHGLSQNRLSRHVVGYAGPTLLVVALANGLSWGAYLDSPWAPTGAGRFFGGESCVLFLLAPRFHAFRATRTSSNYCAFVQNVRAALGGGHGGHASRAHGAGHHPAGADAELVGFGGSAKRYRCMLTDDLTSSVWRSACSTYETDTARLGALGLADDEAPQRVSALEVWGLGGVSADSALHSVRLALEKGRAAAGRVNRSAFGETWHDSPDKMLMELGGHTFHSDQLRQPERTPGADSSARYAGRG
ncbi:hypothetical protein KFE25_007811 [Diacronema lutheri]|uniref:TLDc domain-containing protein n=2 Tax=Diacronema lutheri TaxID=2081491 RepID=A0A8J5XK04_DIALT|nr:hypothetical protein KFE25_007811 [Diacronema lutheri]